LERDRAVLRTIRLELVSANHEVVGAWHPAGALAVLTGRWPPVRVLLADLGSLETDRAVVAEAQQRMPQMPIILVSADHSPEQLGRLGPTLGAWRTLAKPFTRDALIAVIESCLFEHRAP
jgi:DNA-binding response OmpR family regulator